MRTCTVEGCNRKHAAKGLCTGHYNRANYTPEQRHPKVAQSCAVCGAAVVKFPTTAGRRVVCSYECRYVLTYGRRKPSMDLVGPMPRTCPVPQPERPATVPTLRFLGACCQWCGASFVQDLRVTGAPILYCSRRCSRARAKADRKGREHGAVGTFTLAELVKVWIGFGKCCAYCERPTTGLPEPDHVVPLSRGGSNSLTNILPSCPSCNADKNDMTLSEWPADRERRGLPSRVTSWPNGDDRVRHLVLGSPTRPRWVDISRAA